MSVEISQAQSNMMSQQLRAWGVLDQDVLDLFARIPREEFTPPDYRDVAYADTNIPLGHGQTMMGPKESARMLQALTLQSSDKVLQVGVGSGFVTALLASKTHHVTVLDPLSDLMVHAKQCLVDHNFQNVSLITDDGSRGWDSQAPYDVIVITGSLPSLPAAFRESLTLGGRLFVTLGTKPLMEATLIVRETEDSWKQEKLFETSRPRVADVQEPRHFEF